MILPPWLKSNLRRSNVVMEPKHEPRSIFFLVDPGNERSGTFAPQPSAATPFLSEGGTPIHGGASALLGGCVEDPPGTCGETAAEPILDGSRYQGGKARGRSRRSSGISCGMRVGLERLRSRRGTGKRFFLGRGRRGGRIAQRTNSDGPFGRDPVRMDLIGKEGSEHFPSKVRPTLAHLT